MRSNLAVIGQEAAICEVLRQGRPAGAGLTGPRRGGLRAVPAAVPAVPRGRPPCFRPTPRCGARSLRSLVGGWARSGWVVLPRYTHPGTNPVYPPCTPVPPTSVHPADGRTTQNSRFQCPVGEPRGVEYRPVSGSRAGLY